MTLALCFMLGTGASLAQSKINLSPRPVKAVVGTGTLTLTPGLIVSTGTLGEDIAIEAARFVSAINATCALNAKTLNTDNGLIRLEQDASIKEGGYNLAITKEGITLKAAGALGFYYGFQSIKKLMPANVMVNKPLSALPADSQPSEITLPVATITDEPRFGYRGFMLDVGRHFFQVDEIKRILDIMAAYKMNVFHWHLTEDQGWRAEIKKYPKLTTIGATASNCRMTDIKHGTYWTNKPYGPYFYTQDEMREIVKYAADRHIDVLPEVDMPGHFVAALAAYPEFSCNPSNPPTVWTNGGISSNVLNVANPKAMQFVKDVIDELVEIFPYPFFHIGGDECPTSAWQGNAECKARYAELGLTDYRQLQSHFINEITGYLKSKGRRTVMWNESITAKNADLNLVKEHNPIIMCWTPCQSAASQAADLGLSSIITEYHGSTNGLGGGYYINRRQSSSPNEPDGAGYGDDTVEGCYKYVPVPTSVSAERLPFYAGVQGTFWTEWVGNPEYLEYLALPRLMAVAEAGWTPQSGKDFEDFKNRMANDTTMLNVGGYTYGRHMWADPLEGMIRPELGKWYRIQTMATDDERKGTCIELLSANSPLITTYSSKGAAANRIWNNKIAQEGDANFTYQQWCLEDSPTAPGLYAIVNRAFPEGSLNPTPTSNTNGGRWTYDTTKKNYAFVLGDGGHGKADDGNYFYTIRANQLSGWYFNSSMSGQGYSVNLWTSPNDGKGGQWEFFPFESGEGDDDNPDFDQAIYDALPKIAEKDIITLECAVPGFENQYLYHRTGSKYVLWNEGKKDDATRWIAYKVTTMDKNYCQKAVLRNASTKFYIFNQESASQGLIGYPVTCQNGYSSAPLVTIKYQPDTKDYQLLVNNTNLYPVPEGSPTLPGIISSGNTVDRSGLALRPQGNAWHMVIDNTPTTAIDLVAPESKDAPIYDLSGRPVSTPRMRGIYIIGNKKVVK
ncbi:MAG: beta-N-acetylhexosaminidase [Bacteroidales bacterium]|nr:beta-N-acetylhexosaminidase [Candidatus Physcousia equi]